MYEHENYLTELKIINLEAIGIYSRRVPWSLWENLMKFHLINPFPQAVHD